MSTDLPLVDSPRYARVHSLAIRITHWLNAVAMFVMITSGWRIYNASPLFGFTFPDWMTTGGWLGGAIAWHLAGMWLLIGNGLVYLGYGVAGQHFRRRMLPISPVSVARDFAAACQLKLQHQHHTYNAVQRLIYVIVVLAGIAAVVSGLSLWKPVQFQGMTALLGGFETVRRVHFFAMASIAGFVVIHLALVAIVPSTLRGMITGRVKLPAPRQEVSDARA